MNYDEKKEFLEHSKELARNLEEKTDEYHEVLIGWIDGEMVGDLPVKIMLNHEKAWFGCNHHHWNENVIWDSINEFTPVADDYLVLNDLIDEVYK